MQTQTMDIEQEQGNFDFLKDGLSELYTQACLAERYFTNDPQSSLVKMRLFVEIACHDLGRHFSLCPPVHGELANKIKILDASGYVEGWVIDAMNSLRLEGNRSVHLTEINGNHVAKLEVSTLRMRQHMRNLHDIARYVAEKVLNVCCKQIPDWHEPLQCDISEHVAAALNGHRDSSFYLANRFYHELETMRSLKGTDRWWTKNTFIDKQADLAYWLEKAHTQGHSETWLLFAKSYAKKLLQDVEQRDAKSCFKLAIKQDETGEAAYEYGRYLTNHGETKLGLTFIKQAAEKGFNEALSAMLEKTVATDDYPNWLHLALKCNVLEAYTCEAFRTLEEHETEASATTTKRLKSALVNAQARRAPGYQFVKAYADLHVFKVITPECAAKIMVDHYKDLPEYLWYESKLFTQICQNSAYFSLVSELYQRAIYQADDEHQASEIKFRMAQLALAEFTTKKSVKTPADIPTMLKEAADAGHPEAREFINSTKGKAVMKRCGFRSSGNHQKSATSKDKQKRKRKLAKKAKRK
ncbi:DUF4145 domain-containing protein [Photobacterium kagoshimensis]|uniref:DUF4145 domain-containing protein n=1 Tax=Photobacterium kagoshimensis TaxID=2910242 RepID=UPI003D129F85